MVSWREAFRGALSTLLWSVVWIMIGLGIIVVAGLFGGVRMVMGPAGVEFPRPNLTFMIPATIVGVFIISLGWMAAFYKMQHEVIARAREGRRSPGAQGQPTIICPSCGGENLPGSRYCIKCGSRMEEP